MKQITQYNSVLAAIEFKNPYDGAAKFLKENQILKEFDFGPILADLNPSYGVKMLRLSKDKPPAKIQINQIRIQYEDSDVSIEKTNQISEIMDQLQEARKKITNNEGIEFEGVILKAIYELENDELQKIKERFFNYGDKFEMGELKLNFFNREKLNYNVVFILQKDNKLSVIFDINTRFVDNQDDWNIEKIVNKIKKYTENNENLLKLLKVKHNV